MIEARARPEYAHVLLDLLVSDTEVIGRAAFRSDTQLVKNVFGTAKRKILFGPEAAGELEQDFGIGARFSRRRHGLPDSRNRAPRCLPPPHAARQQERYPRSARFR